ncbi:hypothetical protein SNE40_004377 [Patella caerulea]|uniref:GST C-terminal domain-containing protein n=1 Tax=Patella caerulea TaxID=87958 RepID=A0AAN8QCB4_PATCE
MAAVEKELRDVAAYLGVPCGKITFNELVPVLNGKIKGLTTILKHLTRESKNTFLFGNNAEDQAFIDQWLEYRVTSINTCSNEKELSNRLKELNLYLSDKVYFVGNHITLADVSIYHAVHGILADMTYSEKENLIHLSRWLDNIQQSSELRQSLPLLPFSKTLLYH